MYRPLKGMLAVAATVAILAAPVAHAADRGVARLVQLSGSVLVSNDYDIAAAGEGLRLAPGMRVLVTRNSRAVVLYADGCRVLLAADERFEVVTAVPCAQRRASPSLASAAVRAGLR